MIKISITIYFSNLMINFEFRVMNFEQLTFMIDLNYIKRFMLFIIFIYFKYSILKINIEIHAFLTFIFPQIDLNLCKYYHYSKYSDLNFYCYFTKFCLIIEPLSCFSRFNSFQKIFSSIFLDSIVFYQDFLDKL